MSIRGREKRALSLSGASAPHRVERGESDVERRFIELQGARNFRDFGGYPTISGRRLKWRCLFRSNKLSYLSATDLHQLDALGLRTIFDLRSRREREIDPTSWSNDRLIVRNFRPGHKRYLVDMAADYPRTVDGVLNLMHHFYAEMPFTMAHVFRAIIMDLADGAAPTPCLIHCSAGKDRTGVAAALLQAALGVERKQIIADYELTNGRARPASDMARAVAPGQMDSEFRSQYPPEAIAAMMAADGSYIEASMRAIEQRHGTTEAYLEEALQLDGPTLQRLREHLLEPA